MTEGGPVSGKTCLPALCTFLAAVVLLAPGCGTRGIEGGPVRERRLVDGTYRGRSRYGIVRVKVEVRIKDGAIEEVNLLRHFHGRGREAEGPVIEQIIGKQSTSVDAVTGATGSSVAIMNAVEDALGQAGE